MKNNKHHEITKNNDEQLDKQKLAQNEELAKLRADTAMAKSEMSAEVKLTSDLMKAADVKTLKGPRR